ncbi:hypothetical protein KAFR_0K00590 [Kazachstania africana CBS 2517]|uniref:GLC7-interacting protein 4 n=1 Tax=Kazachstania africana (strain ATCC 22294 / BCRC 22015 / CBS 2517 / CECT 1963 / NBRC 1671 / NRRL Y-8276) TaxID=1071382 RepID=H2B1B4_KAZAF|nr:hypothetical protein KAFR_0K00590 [Kazachstania africana CBS 2517]CCF60414.1 hypothetical protein KAFR_0K00590 [Kazachstania africana CBS 2517]
MQERKMFAKAAAHASVPGVKYPVQLDLSEVKFIQFKTALYKLQEILRLLNLLEKNLKKSKDDNDNSKTIPLMNYILLLCEGPIFNVHPLIRKRFNLLLEFKTVKLTEVDPLLSTDTISLDYNFPVITSDNYSYVKGHIYNEDLQWKLLSSLKVISQNSLTIYNRKLRQLQLEKSSIMRKYEASGIKNGFQVHNFKINCIEDLLRPNEMSLALELAVLIKDIERDTTDKSFLKLQYQVLHKFISITNNKVLPVFKTFYNQLQKYSTKSNSSKSNNSLKDFFPNNSDFIINRIYTFLLRMYHLLNIMISFSRQIYLPSRTFFYYDTTKLRAKNVYEYEQVLVDLDKFCLIDSEDPDQDFSIRDIKHLLEKYSSTGITFQANINAGNSNSPNTVISLHQESVLKFTGTFKSYLKIISRWCVTWKFINENTSISKLERQTTSQLEKVLDERRIVDKLSYLEKQDKMKRTDSLTIGSTDSFLSPSLDSALSTAPSTPPSGNLTSDELSRKSSKETSYIFNMNSPSMLSPRKLSRNPSINTSSSINTSKTTIVNRTITTGSSGASPKISPQVSRNGSLIERQSGAPKRIRGRPRSSSLQSSFANQNKISTVRTKTNAVSYPRSNSLEVDATLNQRIVQQTVRLLVNNKPIEEKKNQEIPSLKQEPENERINNNKARSPLSNKTHKAKTCDALKSPISNGTRIGNSSLSVQILAGEKHSSNPSPVKKKADEDIHDRAVNNLVQIEEDILTSSHAEKLIFADFESEEGELQTISTSDTVKKVRFTGVPPMTDAENPKPKRKGWYKKPAVLHYPPIPPQISLIKNRITQEGIAFRTSLRDDYKNYNDQVKEKKTRNFSADKNLENESSNEKRTSMLFNLDGGLNPFKESTSQRIASKIRDKLRS